VSPARGPRSDVLLAVILEGIATDRIPLASVEDVAALYAWLTVMLPTLADPPPMTSPVTVPKITHNYARKAESA
jgi:hypothetical protein